MKRVLTVLGMVMTAALLVISCDGSSKETPAKYKIGDPGPAGGIIFYDAKTVMTSTYKNANREDVTYEWRYLEAAPSDLSGTYYFGYPSNTQEAVGGTSAAIGSGRANTRLIVNSVDNTRGAYYSSSVSDTNAYGFNYAAYQAEAYRNKNEEGTKHDDWFLPSTEELKLMYENLKKAGLGGTWQQEGKYWSSVEYDRNNAYVMDFYNGNTSYSGRTSSTSNLCYVRPIRAVLE